MLPAALVNYHAKPMLGTKLISPVACISLLDLGELVFGTTWKVNQFPPVDAASKAQLHEKSLLQSLFC